MLANRPQCLPCLKLLGMQGVRFKHFVYGFCLAFGFRGARGLRPSIAV